ncbi:MAG: hypothetical protein ACRBBP_00610 [Bdellovibrionales bacterium]
MAKKPYKIRSPPPQTSTGFADNSDQLRQSTDNSTRINSSFHRDSTDNPEDADEILTDLTIYLNGNGMTPHRFFKKYYYPIRDNLTPYEFKIVSTYVEQGVGADEVLRHFSFRRLLNKLGIQKGILGKYDHKIDELEEKTLLDQPVRPLPAEFKDTYSDFDFSFNSFGHNIIINKPEVLQQFQSLDTVDRYAEVLLSLKNTLTDNLENLTNSFFNPDDLKTSLKNQTRRGHYYISFIAGLDQYNKILKRGTNLPADENWIVEYTFLSQEVPKLIKLLDYQDVIEENPSLFIEAMNATQEVYQSSNPINFYYLANHQFDNSVLLHFLKDDRVTPDFPMDFYKKFTHNFFFNEKFFFTAEPNEEEVK